jgi:Uncharacterized conserved protein
MTEEIQVDITQKAETEIHELLEERGMEGHGISVSVEYSDGEVSYILEFSESPKDNEMTIDDNEVPIYVSKEAAAAIDGCTVDYVVQNGRAGFSVETPSISDSDEFEDSLEGRVREFLSRNFPQIQGHGGKSRHKRDRRRRRPPAVEPRRFLFRMWNLRLDDGCHREPATQVCRRDRRSADRYR